VLRENEELVFCEGGAVERGGGVVQGRGDGEEGVAVSDDVGRLASKPIVIDKLLHSPSISDDPQDIFQQKK
jgi:hypothetical protein